MREGYLKRKRKNPMWMWEMLFLYFPTSHMVIYCCCCCCCCCCSCVFFV